MGEEDYCIEGQTRSSSRTSRSAIPRVAAITKVYYLVTGLALIAIVAVHIFMAVHNVRSRVVVPDVSQMPQRQRGGRSLADEMTSGSTNNVYTNSDYFGYIPAQGSPGFTLEMMQEAREAFLKDWPFKKAGPAAQCRSGEPCHANRNIKHGF